MIESTPGSHPPIPPSRGSPGPSVSLARLLPSILPQEDDCLWEISSLAIPRVPPLIFHPYIVFSLHNNCFIGPFEKHRHKNVGNKIRKNIRSCGTRNACDPAKCGLKRTGIELTMLDFRGGGGKRALLTRRLIRLIATSLFGTRGTWCSPLCLAIGEHR